MPYYDGGDGYHGVMLRYDPRREFTAPSSWDWADGGLTDGLKDGEFQRRCLRRAIPVFRSLDGRAALPRKNHRQRAHPALRHHWRSGRISPALLRSRSQRRSVRRRAWASFIVNTEHGPRGVRANCALAVGRHHLAGIYDGQTVSLYIDGELVDQQPCYGKLVTNQTDLTLGSIRDGSDQFKGTIFQIRLSDVARSDRWVETEANNLIDPPGFCRCID